MACITPDCLPSTPAGAGLNVVNTPQRTCSGQTFCDPKLAGLPFKNAVDLVGVAEGEECLSRLGMPKGVWQHDPAHPGGADYTGPIEGLQIVAGTAGVDECGHIPLLRDVADGAVEVVAQNLSERSDGDIGLLIKCPSGKARHDILVPEAFDVDNPCEANLSLLGYVLRTVIVNGKNVSQKVWKQITRLLFPATQLSELGVPDYAAGTLWRRAAWKKSGTCWELGLPTADTPTGDCSALVSTGSEFPYLLACKDGIYHKVEPTNGMSLQGDGSNWNVRRVAMTRCTRFFVGQKNDGFTTTTNIVGVVDTTGVTSGAQSGTFDMTTVPGYVAGAASIAYVRGITIVNTTTPGEASAQVKLNNEVMLEAWIDSSFAFGYKNDGPSIPVALTGDTFTFELVATASSVAVQAWSKLEIIGWQ